MNVKDQVVTCPSCSKRNRIRGDAVGVPRCARCHEPIPWILDADDDTFEAVVMNSKMAVLVDLWAPWCGPCRTVSPIVEAIGRDMAGKIKVVKVNVDEANQTASKFDARSIPTLLLMRGGKVVARQVGALPARALRSWVEQAISAG